MWRNENDLSDQEIRREMKPFKIFSGQYQCKILMENDDKNYPYSPIGSGGYLEYKGRHYLVTNEHVANQAEVEKIRAPCVSNGRKCAKFIDMKFDKDSDIAVFEVDESCLQNFDGKTFLRERLIEQNAVEYLKKCNSVFLHATPWENCEIDSSKKEINMTTLPYLTFAKGYDSNVFEIDINLKGIGENEMSINVPNVSGMSGSYAYCYYPDDKLQPYRCFGILSLGNRDAGNLFVLDINLVINFIEGNF